VLALRLGGRIGGCIVSRRFGRALVTVLAGGLALSLGAAAAFAGQAGMLKQFKVPTASSQPRAITNGSDGNRWFTEGTEFTGAPAKIGRITPAGAVTEFSVDCNGCIITDIAQGPGDILYFTSNDPTLGRFTTAGQQLTSVPMPNSSALGGDLAIHGDDIWITDFNNDSLWRYNITSGQFTQFQVPEPADVAVDSVGRVWFSAPLAGTIDELDPATGAVTSTDAGGLIPRDLAIATDGQVWFTARFTPQGVGRLNPDANPRVVTTFPLTNVGPQGIAASPDGTMWFTQTTKGNIANINNTGVITEAKTVKGSQPFGITVAPDANPWYTMMSANKIATLQLR
jgi:streptogramin lyase